MTHGRIFDLKRYSLHDGPGIRTTVFFKGCPLSCWWCHNPESQDRTPVIHYRNELCLGCESCVDICEEHALSLTTSGIERDETRCRLCGACTEVCPTNAREIVGREVSVEDVLNEVEKDRLYYDESGGGVTFSGGEPLAQSEFLLALLRACGERDLHRTVDTSGLAPIKTVIEVAEHTDLFLFDLKVMSPERHQQVTGVPVQPILDNLRALDQRGQALRVRVPMIPGINDDPDNFAAMNSFLGTLSNVSQVDLLPFHLSARNKHYKFGIPWNLEEAEEIEPERLLELARPLQDHGLTVAIGG